MKYNLLIGGQAGQGVNSISEIFTKVLINYGYYIFNYKDYPSLIRGGHNFNIVSFSDKPLASFESKFDGIIAVDNLTIKLHEKNLKKTGFILNSEKFQDLGKDINIALAGALLNTFGIDKKNVLKVIKNKFKTKECINIGEKGFDSEVTKYNLNKLNNKISLMSGSEGVAIGALNSDLNLYVAYPMTPATGVMNELAKIQNTKRDLLVFQAENEIAAVNASLGGSFAGANSMVGTSGGGFDLMSEGLSLQGMSEIPLVVYLASRAGPATGVPTYTSQADLNVALRAGHGEFPRIVVAPGDAYESILLTNQAIYLSNKYNILSIIFSDKHLAESQFSFSENIPKFLKIVKNRKIPFINKEVIKATSYEHDKFGNTIEDPKTTIEGHDRRLKKYAELQKVCEEFEMVKIYGKKNSKNLIIAWGSTKGAIIDAIEDLDCKFLQVLYIKPLSKKIKKEMQNAKNIILVEGNSTGQLGRLLREKTGILIPKENRILKYDARPFVCNELKEEIQRRLK